MAQNQNEHLTIEQLSALLDKQLSPQEEAQSEVHLRTCQQCQGILNDLRQTVALLHALPQPTLPRSFALSPEMLRSAAPSQEQATPVTIQIEERRRQRQQRQQELLTAERNQARRSVLPRTLRIMSTLVALLGFIFIVTAIPFHPGGASSGANSPSNAPTRPAITTPGSILGPHSSPGKKPGATPTVTPQLTPTDHQNSSPATVQGTGPFDPYTQGGRAVDGLLLLVLALLLLLLARGWRVRRT